MILMVEIRDDIVAKVIKDIKDIKDSKDSKDIKGFNDIKVVGGRGLFQLILREVS